MGIKHYDVKATGEKGLASEWNKNHVVDDDVDMVQNQLLNNVIENRTDFPAGPVKGQHIYRTDLNKFYIWDGTAWDEYAVRESKTSYWSCVGINFIPIHPDIDDVEYGYAHVAVQSGTVYFRAPVSLPNGAIVTGVVVWGETGKHYFLQRSTIATGITSIMGTDVMDTEDTSIINATIDNSTYCYVLTTDEISSGEGILGARISYTTYYD